MTITKHRSIAVAFLMLLIAAVIIFISWQKTQNCSRVFTMDDEFDLLNLKQGDVFIDDDFELNSCEGNVWNCEDFCTTQDAQKLLEGCRWSGKSDVNRLDLDGDGVACEVLP